MPDDAPTPKAAPEPQEHMKPLRQPDAVLKGNVNQYALLKHCADVLVNLATSNANTPDQKNSCARSAILLYIVSLETLINLIIDEFWPSETKKWRTANIWYMVPLILINRIIDYFWPDSGKCETKDEAKKWRTVDKWYKVPLRLAGKSFDKSREPYQYLPILFKIRADFVHATRDTFPVVFDLYHNQASNMKEIYTSAEQPKYNQIDLIKAPSQWIASDAQRIKTVTEQLVSHLKCLLKDRITDNWLSSDVWTSSHGQRLTVTRYFQDSQR